MSEAERPDGLPACHRLEQHRREAGVVQAVVADQPCVHRTDPDMLQPVGQIRPQAKEQLVRVRSRRLGDRDDEVPQAGITGNQRGLLDHGQVGDRCSLSGEPALSRQPGGQGFLKRHDCHLPRT